MGTVGKSNVIGCEALLSDGRRGDDEDWARAKMEEENRAVAIGNASEGAMEWVLE